MKSETVRLIFTKAVIMKTAVLKQHQRITSHSIRKWFSDFAAIPLEKLNISNMTAIET
jgi:hypothetical protein